MIRCILCKKLSLSHICKTCQNQFLVPQLSTRTLDDTFKVFSFYRYADIDILLKTKHTHLGASVYKILADIAMKKFSQHFVYEHRVDAVGIDDKSEGGYAHTAILVRALNSPYIKPCYGRLRAQNSVYYSGQSLAYREKHKRDFIYHDRGAKEIILVDDIVTTGMTIIEAKNAIKKVGSTPIFALTLADAREF